MTPGSVPDTGMPSRRPDMPAIIPPGHESEPGEHQPEEGEKGDSTLRKDTPLSTPEIHEEFVPDLEEEEEPGQQKHKKDKKPHPSKIRQPGVKPRLH